ncbi:alpha 1,2-mannosyltransferase 2.4.1 [Lunasporangiospora selenospora]|uniref:Alpha 1,2-mannosyltransferase 2.4.1 n=1 Tax=Lunasporangiospora selenospora TaxID=979761 RepID=A0A9P6KFH5_9FUNG|nr:alpha 1,2-mannosyltransferase 2.4.1 [Lunasporangiospora selenospora]
MIYAPTSRYAKAVRVLVPIAALFGLGYLFLVTFVPDHLLSISTATDQRSYYAGLLKLRSHSNDDEQRLGQQYRRNIQQAHLDMGENEEDLRNAHRGHLGNDIGTRKTEMKLETSSLDPNSAHTGYGIYDSNQNTLLTAPIIGRANGVLVMVIDEQTPGQLQKARETIRHMEDRFNRGRNYPWILLSPAPLSDRAKTLTKFLSNAPIYYSAIAKEHWRLPKWIDPSKVITNDYDLLKFKGLNRTELLTRHRWRFTSGILASLDLMDEFEFFWRIEPGIEIFCDMNDDPMLEMKKSGQKFAFSTSWAQIESGLPSAWSTIQAFKNTHPDLLPEKNDEAFLTRESGDAL